MSPVLDKILKIWDTLFELIQTELAISKKNLPQEDGAFGNNKEMEQQTPHPKLKQHVYYIFTDNVCSAYHPILVAFILQKCISFAEQRLKFSYFDGSIIR